MKMVLKRLISFCLVMLMIFSMIPPEELSAQEKDVEMEMVADKPSCLEAVYIDCVETEEDDEQTIIMTIGEQKEIEVAELQLCRNEQELVNIVSYSTGAGFVVFCIKEMLPGQYKALQVTLKVEGESHVIDFSSLGFTPAFSVSSEKPNIAEMGGAEIERLQGSGEAALYLAPGVDENSAKVIVMEVMEGINEDSKEEIEAIPKEQMIDLPISEDIISMLRQSNGLAAGAKLSGMLEFEGRWYFFSNSGQQLFGWQVIEGKKYFFDQTKRGAAHVGWASFGSSRYYFNSDGILKIGASVIGTKIYLFNNEGVQQYGWQEVEGEKYFFNKADGGAAHIGWTSFGSSRYCFDGAGAVMKGLKVIGTKKYLFNNEGVQQYGWQEVEGEKYFFNKTDGGAAHVGWTSFGASRYYFDEESIMSKGFRSLANRTYFFNESGVQQFGWQKIDNDIYYFNPMNNGAVHVGWASFGRNVYYFLADGKATIGEKEINGKRYCFSAEGILPLFGWREITGKFYYLEEDGSVKIGWKEINGKKYYFNPAKKGAAHVGWASFGKSKYCFNNAGEAMIGEQIIDGKRYVFGLDGILQVYRGWQKTGDEYFYYNENGKQQYGWQVLDGKKYYFNPNNNGAAHIGWASFGKSKYYFNNIGEVVMGMQLIGSSKYYFDYNGVQQYGWQVLDGKKYYFNPNNNGAAHTGWASFGKSKYFFDNIGEAQTGVKYVGNSKYYFSDQGVIITGWQTLDGKKYYFNPNDNGAAHVGWATFGKSKYFFNNLGEVVTGIHHVGSGKHYFNDYGVMLTGWQVLDEKKYYFNPLNNGAAHVGWASFGKLQYCFNNFGEAMIGTQILNGYKHFFKSDGVLLTGWQEIEGETYFLHPDNHGAAWVGFARFGARTYYFNEDGMMLKGWQLIKGNKYYFTNEGVLKTGWIDEGGSKYYFDVEGKMVIGWFKINNQWYYFQSDGKYVEMPVQTPPNLGTYTIEGTSAASAIQMEVYFMNRGYKYPSYYKNTDAPTLNVFCQIYYEEAIKENIRVEVAFAQAMRETNGLRFDKNAALPIYKNNFGGLEDKGFLSVRQGIRAQIQRLKAYAGNTDLVMPKVDWGFDLVERGSSRYVEWLGIRENPYGLGWSNELSYGVNITKLAIDIKNTKVKHGWYYENGYKYYYRYNVRLEDVRGIIGSQSSYVIKINKQASCITVYAKDGSNGYIIPVFAMTCSPGAATPLGMFNTTVQYRWHQLFGAKGQYCTNITTNILFHSLPYYSNNIYDMFPGEYNKLGTWSSAGCIRLRVVDAKWIYDNCKWGTSVQIYNSSTPGPLKKPTYSKIPGNQTWDPTDPAI
ncbi:glucan-binding YG repeat protein [Lachnospiraceae bacterium PF1-22]|uniref:L,D-transpeptidase family protein n=1 Tax=Ohessyouella blattaphilus TaxID=2949333 RepID=UPI003E1CA376